MGFRRGGGFGAAGVFAADFAGGFAALLDFFAVCAIAVPPQNSIVPIRATAPMRFMVLTRSLPVT
jgi:hypothetical protein